MPLQFGLKTSLTMEDMFHGSTGGDGGIVSDEQLPPGHVGEGVLVESVLKHFLLRKILEKVTAFFICVEGLILCLEQFISHHHHGDGLC